jgi:hypothetical protein
MPRSNPLTSALPFCDSHYTTPREVRIRDPRLAAIYAAFAAVVLLYVIVFQLLLEHRYASFEVPVGYANLWGAQVPPWPGSWTEPPLDQQPSHCVHPDRYSWGVNHTEAEKAVTGGFFVSNPVCRGYNSLADAIVTSDAFTVVTFEATTLLNASGHVVDTQHRFTANADAAIMNAIHIYSVSWQPGGQQNVETFLHSRNGSVVKQFPAGSIITGLTVKDWLTLAGVDLEAENPQDAIARPFPRYRVTGVILLVRMVYSNLRRWELPYYRPQCHISVEALPQAWGFLGGTTGSAPGNGQSITVRTGVRVQVIQSGTIGAFDIIQLILRLVEASVLFGFARFATDVLAERQCCLGRRFVHLTTDQFETDRETTPGCYFRVCARDSVSPLACRLCCGLCECGNPVSQDTGLPLDDSSPPGIRRTDTVGASATPVKPYVHTVSPPRSCSICRFRGKVAGEERLTLWGMARAPRPSTVAPTPTPSLKSTD